MHWFCKTQLKNNVLFSVDILIVTDFFILYTIGCIVKGILLIGIDLTNTFLLQVMQFNIFLFIYLGKRYNYILCLNFC